MKRDDSFTRNSRVQAFRLPSSLSVIAREKAKKEDITFSQLVRRAIRRELGIRIEIDPADEMEGA